MYINVFISIIYLGTTDGKIISVQVNNNDFSNSPVGDLKVTTEAITTVQVDSLRGYLYAATAGSSSASPSILYRISLANFSVVDQLVLDSRDFTVSISAISDTAKGNVKQFENHYLTDSNEFLKLIFQAGSCTWPRSKHLLVSFKWISQDSYARQDISYPMHQVRGVAAQPWISNATFCGSEQSIH